MKRFLFFRRTGILWMGLLLLVAPISAYGQAGPPVEGPLVREGNFAVDLEQALGVGTSTDEVEAETVLGNLGIAPRNGWIADYPVTPDVLTELQQAVTQASDSGKLAMGRDDALNRFDNVAAKEAISAAAYNGTPPGQTAPPGGQGYVSPADIDDYYGTEGPPVVTYYSPPPDYYYLYAWVPFPFLCDGYWFPGFFVLHDFHRVVVVDGRPCFVSNHFNDVNVHRVFRIDPGSRFRGKTYAGIGAPANRNFIATGRPGSNRAIFNAPRTRQAPGMTAPAFHDMTAPSSHSATAPASHQWGRSSFHGGGGGRTGGHGSSGGGGHQR